MRDGASTELKEKHFAAVLDSLLTALENTLDRIEKKNEMPDAVNELNAGDSTGY